jgi:hypothetical protein
LILLLTNLGVRLGQVGRIYAARLNGRLGYSRASASRPTVCARRATTDLAEPRELPTQSPPSEPNIVLNRPVEGSGSRARACTGKETPR